MLSTDGVDAVEAGFAKRHGGSPDGVWSAPGRVNLIGEHTDYNEGLVLPFAIDRRALVAVRLRGDRLLRASTSRTADVVQADLDDLRPEAMVGWSAYVLGVAWAFGHHDEAGVSARACDLASAPGFDLHLDSSVPVGAGLSSSAAIECATALALNELWGAGLGRPRLARLGQLTENMAAGAPTGIMDQCASLLGTAGHGVLLDCRTHQSRLLPLPFDQDAAGEVPLAMVVIDTRVTHALAEGGYGQRRESCERAARVLGVGALRDVEPASLERAARVLDEKAWRRVRHVVTEIERVRLVAGALDAGQTGAVGPLLDASHASLRDDFEVSCPELDLAVTAARAAGARGARMTGGGFGGSAIALVGRDDVEHVRRRVLTAFEAADYTIPDVFTVFAADGARRDAGG